MIKWERGCNGLNRFSRIFSSNDGFKRKIRENLLYPFNPCFHKILNPKLLNDELYNVLNINYLRKILRGPKIHRSSFIIHRYLSIKGFCLNISRNQFNDFISSNRHTVII
jgi:hypothetical protein